MMAPIPPSSWRKAGMLLPAIFLAVGPASGGALSEFLCKNSSSDWPLPCGRPSDAIKQYTLGRPDQPASATFPISAWWGPVGYSEPREQKTSDEFLAYAGAGFNNAMVSDRGQENCDNSNSSADWKASWSSIKAQIAMCHKYNMTSLVDSYRCLPWGPPTNIGGDCQGSTGGFVTQRANHKITLPEVKWLASELTTLPGAAGILITDDGVDLARNEIEEIEWMRANTPSLFPWVNQCGDGTEWVARAGSPYAVPELYSVKGTSGNAIAMAQAQLGGYESWIGKSQRFGLTHWPLVGIGDGGGIPNINSTSLTRFQAYSAVAYGAKGIFWYCWGEAIWQFGNASTGVKPGPRHIYPAVQAVNYRLGDHWAPVIAAHQQWQGVFSSKGSWGVPGGLEPKKGLLVEAMSADLLVGVMTTAPPTVAAPAGVINSTLLVIVDKRLSDELAPAAARTATVVLGSAAGENPQILPGGSASVSFDQTTRVLTIKALTGGDAVAIVAEQTAAGVQATELHYWRFNVERPSMRSVWTTQYQFYQMLYKTRTTSSTSFILGSLVALATAADVSVAAVDAGYNLITAQHDGQQEILNAGLRQGFGVIALMEDSEPSSFAKVQAAIGCHPNWAGYLLNGGKNVDASDKTLLGKLRATRDAIIQQSPHAMSFTSASSAKDVLEVSNVTGIPVVALSLPVLPLRTAPILSSVREMTTLRDALPHAIDQPGINTQEEGMNACSFLVKVDPCQGSAGLARLQAYAALAFGSAGVLHESAQCANADRSTSVADVNRNLAQWAPVLDPFTAAIRLTSITQANGEAMWPLPSAVAQGTIGTGSLISSLGPELVVASFQHVNAGRVDASAAPPLMLILDTRLDGDSRNASITLADSVIGWSPHESDVEAGFPKCDKFVLGNKPQPSLLPGGAMLIKLDVLVSAPAMKVAHETTEAARQDATRTRWAL